MNHIVLVNDRRERIALGTSRRFRGLIAVCLTLFAVSHTAAQSTVFNIASTDVLPAHQAYLEADFLAHLSSYESGGFQTYGPRIVYGLGRRTEVGVNVFYTRMSPTEPMEIQPNFKWKFYENEGRGLAAAVGVVISIPITERALEPTRGLVYAVGSKNLPGTFGARLTAGSYALLGSFEQGTSKKGLLLGYEQPVSKRLTFITDWSSGNNDYGYLAAGAAIALSPKSVFYVGYNVGNRGRGNNSLGLYYGFTF
jgi:hypothetical protein